MQALRFGPEIYAHIDEVPYSVEQLLPGWCLHNRLLRAFDTFNNSLRPLPFAAIHVYQDTMGRTQADLIRDYRKLGDITLSPMNSPITDRQKGVFYNPNDWMDTDIDWEDGYPLLGSDMQKIETVLIQWFGKDYDMAEVLISEEVLPHEFFILI